MVYSLSFTEPQESVKVPQKFSREKKKEGGRGGLADYIVAVFVCEGYLPLRKIPGMPH